MTAHTRIGIIGAGLAGCSSALFARDAFPNADITVFERGTHVGGRIHTITFHGAVTELGAGFFHSSNRTTLSLLERMNLNTRPAIGRAPGSGAPLIQLWNGRSFIATMHDGGIVSKARLIHSYGISLFRLRWLVKEMLRRWSRFYEVQTAGGTFSSPEALFNAADLSNLIADTTARVLERHQVDATLRAEFVAASLRAIFNQDESINGFAGTVALAAVGIAGGRTFSVDGGNVLLCERLIERSGARLKTNRRISAIVTNTRQPRYSVTLRSDAGDTDAFDAVIVAAPFDPTTLRLGGDTVGHLPVLRATQMTHVTCVLGQLSPEYFGVPTAAGLPRSLLTTEVASIPFSSILSSESDLPTGARIYKIQSRHALDRSTLTHLFRTISDVQAVEWSAYPTFAPGGVPSFRLASRVYYPNAIEAIVSTMETQAVASKNVISLLAADLAVQRSRDSVMIT